MNQEYYIEQIFEGKYPPEAAIWCNSNNAVMVKLEDKKYQIQAIPEPSEEEKKQALISELKAKLDGTDYKIIKCSECQLAGAEMPYDVAALHAERQALRDEINRLQGE